MKGSTSSYRYAYIIVGSDDKFSEEVSKLKSQVQEGCGHSTMQSSEYSWVNGKSTSTKSVHVLEQCSGRPPRQLGTVVLRYGDAPESTAPPELPALGADDMGASGMEQMLARFFGGSFGPGSERRLPRSGAAVPGEGTAPASGGASTSTDTPSGAGHGAEGDFPTLDPAEHSPMRRPGGRTGAGGLLGHALWGRPIVPAHEGGPPMVQAGDAAAAGRFRQGRQFGSAVQNSRESGSRQ